MARETVKAVKEPRIEKVNAVKAIKEDISKSNIIIFTDHQSLTVAQMTSLRDNLWKGNAVYKVVKNTIAERSFEGENLEKIKAILSGPTSIIFGFADPVQPAKALTTFLKENEKPAIKGAVMEGRFVDASMVKKIASLPTREVLIAMALAGMKSPITSFVNVLSGPIRKLVYTLDAISKKKGG